jgi:hypothetical protein
MKARFAGSASLAAPGGGKRPWVEVFGLEPKDLKARWLQSLEAKKPDGKNVEALLLLLNRSPKDACSEAQRLAKTAAGGKCFPGAGR